MKKYLFLLLSVFFISQFLSGQSVFEVGIFGGIKNSEISKSIYLENTDTKVSALSWNQEVLPIGGLDFAYQFKNFFVEATLTAGIPITTGTMYDSDWNLAGIKKTYSIHKCDTNLDVSGVLQIKYAFHPLKKISFSPVLELDYSFVDFTAHDGYGWYGGYEHAKDPRGYDVSWDDPLARKAKKLRDIDYYRHCFFVFSGVEMNVQPSEKIGIKAALKFSPFSYMYSYDTHHRQEVNTHYLDIQSASFSKLKLEFEPYYNISEKFNLYLNTSFIFGSEDYGDLYHDEYSEKPTKSSRQPTGGNIKSITVSMGAAVKLSH